MVQVEGDAVLVSVYSIKYGRPFVSIRTGPSAEQPEVVQALYGLNFDDLGPQIAQ
jgi:hypothetical protein